jgi:hypothetical protein
MSVTSNEETARGGPSGVCCALVIDPTTMNHQVWEINPGKSRLIRVAD